MLEYINDLLFYQKFSLAVCIMNTRLKGFGAQTLSILSLYSLSPSRFVSLWQPTMPCSFQKVRIGSAANAILWFFNHIQLHIAMLLSVTQHCLPPRSEQGEADVYPEHILNVHPHHRFFSFINCGESPEDAPTFPGRRWGPLGMICRKKGEEMLSKQSVATSPATAPATATSVCMVVTVAVVWYMTLWHFTFH